jgi:hypothetical protein
MPSLRFHAGLIGLALFMAACQPAATATMPPEPTAEPAAEMPTAEMPATEESAVVMPEDQPTVAAEMVEPEPDDGSPDPGPAPEGGAEPAVQLVAMTDLDSIQAGREAQMAVLTADSDGVDRVELQIDGQVVSTVSANQATEFQGVLAWTPEAAGDVNAVVIVFDAMGLPGQAEQRTLTVRPADPTAVPPPAGATAVPAPTAVPPTAVPSDTTPPAVSITPLTPRVAPGEDIQIAANAVDDSGVVLLELFMSGRLVDSSRHDPATGPAPKSMFRTLHFRNARVGQYDAWVRATDSAGNVGESVRERVRVREPEATE